MRFLTFDELPESTDSGRALVNLAAFGSVAERRGIDLWRRRTSALSDYVGVFAVEHGIVVGQTFVFRIPFAFPHGTEIVSGLAGVSTRLDRARSGIAHRILDEVHRREREAGIGYCTLWTNRSWGAHRLYEKIGYRDIYTPPIAVRVPDPPRKSASDRTVRPGRRTDLPEIEALHARFAEGRRGFARRVPGIARVAAAAGELRPKEQVLVMVDNGRLSGYAVVDASRNRIVCGELVALSAARRVSMARSLENRAGGAAVVFRDSVVPDLDMWLRRRSYAVAPAGWFGLMGWEIGRTRSSSALVREFGTEDPRFLCMSGDRF